MEEQERLEEFKFLSSVTSDTLPADLTDFASELSKQLGLTQITSRKALIRVLAQLICATTGIHEHVGQVSDYMLDPRFVCTKLRRDEGMNTVQSYTQVLTLAALTGLKMPGLLEDWSHLVPHNDGSLSHAHLLNYRKFRLQLVLLSRHIDRLNADRNARRYPFQSFNPRFMEVSVSV